MEDWIQVDDDASPTLQDKNWDHSEIRLSSIHDPSEHWKPFLSTGSSVQPKSKRLSLDEPEFYSRFLQETLIEKETCADHVLKVWSEISKVIVEKLKEGYGVKIAGLGAFTYCLEQTRHPSTIYKCKLVTKKIPIMVPSEFVVRMYKLITPCEESLSQVPIVSLNLAPVIANTRLPRRIVDGVITEVLQSFARAVVCGKNVEFPFPFIGKLQISDRRIIFKFYAEFCHQLDFESSEFQDGDVVRQTDTLTLPGAMTPLRRHIPTAEFRSVFHLREVRSVHQFDLLAPVKKLDNGKYTATSGLDGLQPVCTMVEDSTDPTSFKLDDLYGPSLHNRLTISWVRGKRDYKSTKPWPPHHFHVVGSEDALLSNSVSSDRSSEGPISKTL